MHNYKTVVYDINYNNILYCFKVNVRGRFTEVARTQGRADGDDLHANRRRYAGNRSEYAKMLREIYFIVLLFLHLAQGVNYKILVTRGKVSIAHNFVKIGANFCIARSSMNYLFVL